MIRETNNFVDAGSPHRENQLDIEEFFYHFIINVTLYLISTIEIKALHAGEVSFLRRLSSRVVWLSWIDKTW